MSISSVTSKVIYVGTGSTAAAAKVFAYPFKILAEGDLTVSDFDIATSAATVKVLTTDYVVSGVGASGGGNVTLTGSYTNLSTSSKLVIQRIVDLTQETDYVENDAFSAETHERALDKLTMIVQQQQDELDRAIKADITQLSGSTTYLDVISQATVAAASSATVAVNQVSASTSSANASIAAANAAQTYSSNASTYATLASASAASVSSGVTTVLDNLGTPVAINESLLPGSSNYINIGSSAKEWNNIFASGTGNFVTVKATLVSTASITVPTFTTNTGNITTVVSTLLSGSTLDVAGTGSIMTVRATTVSSSTLRVSGTANINTIAGLASPLTTAQGGTQTTAAANAAGGVVVLDAYSQLPAVDGSLLTGMSNTAGAGTITSTMLKTTTGEISITETSSGAAAASSLATLPGGIYGFDTLYKAIQSAGNATTHYVCAIKGDINIAIAADGTLTLTKRTTASGPNESYTNKISLGFWKQYSSGSTTLTYYAQQTYVTASGEDLWIYLLVNKNDFQSGIDNLGNPIIHKKGTLIAAYQSPDHPAYGNGGDFDKVSHPFCDYDETKHEIVLVDKETCSAIKVESEKTGKSILTLVNEQYSVDMDKEEPYKPLHSGKFIDENNRHFKQMVEKIPNYIKVKKLRKTL